MRPVRQSSGRVRGIRGISLPLLAAATVYLTFAPPAGREALANGVEFVHRGLSYYALIDC